MEWEIYQDSSRATSHHPRNIWLLAQALRLLEVWAESPALGLSSKVFLRPPQLPLLVARMHQQLSCYYFSVWDRGEEKTKKLNSLALRKYSQKLLIFLLPFVVIKVFVKTSVFLILTFQRIYSIELIVDLGCFRRFSPAGRRRPSPPAQGVYSLRGTIRCIIQFLHTNLTKWLLQPFNYSGEKESWLVLFFHNPHPICPKIQLALHSEYIQDLTTPHHLGCYPWG